MSKPLQVTVLSDKLGDSVVEAVVEAAILEEVEIVETAVVVEEDRESSAGWYPAT